MKISMTKLLENEKFATKIATGLAGTVYVTTGIKAIGRPAFIYADKNSDKETKKYTAGKEFLYQLLCLGITIAMLPLFKTGGKKLAEKFIARRAKLNNPVKTEQSVLEGGKQLGNLVGSILGLTILAPMISHEILHPIMKAIGLEKPKKPVQENKVDTKA